LSARRQRLRARRTHVSRKRKVGRSESGGSFPDRGSDQSSVLFPFRIAPLCALPQFPLRYHQRISFLCVCMSSSFRSIHQLFSRRQFILPKCSTLAFRPQLRRQATAAWPYIYRQHPSPNMAPQLDAYFSKVDELQDHFIERLRKAVAIPSVSSEDDRRPEVVRVCPRAIPLSAYCEC
jgi:hypothetical protein